MFNFSVEVPQRQKHLRGAVLSPTQRDLRSVQHLTFPVPTRKHKCSPSKNGASPKRQSGTSASRIAYCNKIVISVAENVETLTPFYFVAVDNKHLQYLDSMTLLFRTLNLSNPVSLFRVKCVCREPLAVVFGVEVNTVVGEGCSHRLLEPLVAVRGQG